jgi:hypothetical protein
MGSRHASSAATCPLRALWKRIAVRSVDRNRTGELHDAIIGVNDERHLAPSGDILHRLDEGSRAPMNINHLLWKREPLAMWLAAINSNGSSPER